MGCCDEDNFDPVSTGIAVENNGTPLGTFTTLNFQPGLVAADAGGGVADITGGGGSGTTQVFRYVATGAEANPFPVALPVAQASTNYNVHISWGGPDTNTIKSFNALVSSFTVNGFDVLAGAAPEADDILMITVNDLT